MSHKDGLRARFVAVAGLAAVMVSVSTVGMVVAQSPSSSLVPDAVSNGASLDPFPSAAEIGEILGFDVEARGISDGLSQIWEITDVVWEALPSARLQLYTRRQDERQAQTAAVFIDVARFASTDEALMHVDDVFGDGDIGLATDLSSDFVSTATSELEDGSGGAYIFARAGSVVVVVTAVASDETEAEAVTEKVVRLVLGRLDRHR